MITAGSMVRQRLPGANGLHAPQAAGPAQVCKTDQDAATDWAAGPAESAIAFGPFRLLPARRLLLQADRPVRLGSRALDILIALVERAGELVGKNELIAWVWPSTFVEEGDLRVHVAGLRRALGDSRGGRRYLATVPGRGYRFVAPVWVAERSVFRGPLSPRTTCDAGGSDGRSGGQRRRHRRPARTTGSSPSSGRAASARRRSRWRWPGPGRGPGTASASSTWRPPRSASRPGRVRRRSRRRVGRRSDRRRGRRPARSAAAAGAR